MEKDTMTNLMKNTNCSDNTKLTILPYDNLTKPLTRKPVTKITIELIKKIAADRGGLLLDDVYTTALEKLRFKCSVGHIFERNYDMLKNRDAWCQACVPHLGETITREIMNILFNAEFTKQSPVCLQGLKLDGYNENLKIGFEYDGKQHYSFSERYHVTQDRYEVQKQMDIKKNKLCEENKITLVRVPYFVKNKNILKYLRNELTSKHIKIPNDVDIDYTKIREIYMPKNDLYKKLEEYVKDNNGSFTLFDNNEEHELSGSTVPLKKYSTESSELKHPSESSESIKSTQSLELTPGAIQKDIQDVNNVYPDNNTKTHSLKRKYISHDEDIKIKCNNGHEFISQYDKLVYTKTWCSVCKNDKRITGMLEKIINRVKEMNGEMISPGTDYKNRFSKFKFKCQKGHIFDKKIDALLIKKRWCKICKSEELKAADILKMHQLAESYGGICLSNKYPGSEIPVIWKCRQGHEFSRPCRYIIKKQIFCKICHKDSKSLKHSISV